MDIKSSPYLFLFCITWILNSVTFGQLIRNDDFKFKNNYWFFRADGNQSIPTVHDGLLHLKLLNANSSEYCNTEIYDPSEPYSPGTQLRMRLKCSPQHIGTRGWGFWDGDLDLSILYDYDVAWVMEQKSNNTAPEYNWFLFGVDGNSLDNRKTIDLSGLVDETEWHTYKIIWRADSTIFEIDDIPIFAATSDLPDENMRLDLWIDNRVINIDYPWLFSNNNSAGSEMFVDFVELSGINGPSIPRSPSGSIILWDSPNSFPSGKTQSLWKTYNFSTKRTGQTLIFITGDAESYSSFSGDDDLRIILDNTDFGWNSPNSLNGDELVGSGKSIVIPINLAEGQHSLKLYSDITPFLKDVIILNELNGEVVINNNYNEFPDTNDGLWKTINFTSSKENETVFLISGSGFAGDKIRVELDNINYTWDGENSINGDELLGSPKTIVLNEKLHTGDHTLRLYKIGSPKLFSVTSYSYNIAYINTKIFLEGSYVDLNGMQSIIPSDNNFPKTQPFNKTPWNYVGKEAVTSVPDNIIDWVLLELRDNQLAPNKKYFRAAFLREDGIIVDLDGGYVKFSGIESGNYYIVMNHRNHLSVMSSNPIPINSP